jgi:UDP-N-acetylglucosamine transferase subunit ALG13
LKSALVTILDWGLGHATRCVPVIKELQKQNVSVIIGGSGLSLIFLKEEFPSLTFYELPSYGVIYQENGSMWFSIMKQLPKIYSVIRQERKAVARIIVKEKIDFIVSDNRYGCFSKSVKSVFLGHQLNLRMPAGSKWLSKVVNRLHSNAMRKFDEVWIPDEANGFSYSGVLSDNGDLHTRRVGILSRFGHETKKPGEVYDIVALISGPEPQRTIFENLCRQEVMKCNRKSLMIRGRPGESATVSNGLLTEVGHLRSEDMEAVLRNCGVVLSRSGYSTIMDLATLNKKAVFIPTPNQTEQEYLAEYFMINKMAFAQPQARFDLEVALSELQRVGALPQPPPNSLLSNAIKTLVQP